MRLKKLENSPGFLISICTNPVFTGNAVMRQFQDHKTDLGLPLIFAANSAYR
jgi:hypothetical protein